MKENKKVQHNLDLSGKTIVNARLVNCKAEGGFASELMSTLLERISVLDEYLGIDSGKIDPALEKYFTIEATEDGTTIYFRQSSYAESNGLDPLKVEVSTDGGVTWEEIIAAVAKDDVPGATLASLDAGDKVLIRGRNEAYGFSSPSEGDFIENCNFFADQPCYIYGNIMSLVGGNDFSRLRKVSDYAFTYLFSNYGELDYSWVLSKDGEPLSLPATTLAKFCYYRMFGGCTSLVQAPELPATSLAPYCYSGMFLGCTSLAQAPALPATTLAENCYNLMFSGCTSLAQAPALPATTLAKDCYGSMFDGCTSLAQAPALPATTLAEECYYGMFSGCTSLAQAPALPATTLVESCYERMFDDCTSLVQAPELPATTLFLNCYKSMFDDCTSLNYIKALFTTTPSITYTGNWVKNVNANGTFVKNSEATWNVTGKNGVPSGWTVETADA